MRLWIASDYTCGAYYTIPETPDQLDPIAVAYKYGRAESGEIVRIWYDNNPAPYRDADAKVYWDSIVRKYRRH